jgi:hypothetical protein
VPKIAISYRRSDSAAVAGRIFDYLTTHYGEKSIFMDIDGIPFGVDFRKHVQETLLATDVLIAIIGAKWIGVDAGAAPGGARIQEKTDPVRTEIETALKQHTPIIPVLVDGAKMPQSSDLPTEFGNFAFLNALEMTSGRDFRVHMHRLIDAIDLTLGVDRSSELPHLKSSKTRVFVADAKESTQRTCRLDVLKYFAIPLVLLLVAHHFIVNALGLNNKYLWLVSAVVPLVFGFAFNWLSGRGAGAATAVAFALGAIGVAGMTVSESLNSGDPLMPQTRFEWIDNIQFAGTIALSFVAGNVLARTLHRPRSQKPRRS